MKQFIYILGVIASTLLIVASWFHWIPMGRVEVLGFVTGAWCVWLIVKESIWNWPIGIANAAFYTVLFWKTRLFADMGLQVVYIVLGFLGWYWWLYGGENKSKLPVSRITLKSFMAISVLTGVATYVMTLYLRHIMDAAPFWDALTTALSLAAQYLLTKKFIENWYVWISADIIYIFLYAYKDLYLTSLLYLVFMIMCIMGLLEWNKSISKRKDVLISANIKQHGNTQEI